MTLKGRHWVMLWLVVALVVLGTVTARQTLGYAASGSLTAAREERAGLEARRGEIERRIHEASSRQVLVPRASASLGLHEPTATEFTVFRMPEDLQGGLPPEVTAPRDTVRSAAAAPARVASRPPAKKKPAAKPPARRPASRSTTRRP